MNEAIQFDSNTFTVQYNPNIAAPIYCGHLMNKTPGEHVLTASISEYGVVSVQQTALPSCDIALSISPNLGKCFPTDSIPVYDNGQAIGSFSGVILIPNADQAQLITPTPTPVIRTTGLFTQTFYDAWSYAITLVGAVAPDGTHMNLNNAQTYEVVSETPLESSGASYPQCVEGGISGTGLFPINSKNGFKDVNGYQAVTSNQGIITGGGSDLPYFRKFIPSGVICGNNFKQYFHVYSCLIPGNANQIQITINNPGPFLNVTRSDANGNIAP